MGAIRIHQIYYREDQREFLDQGFIPRNNLKNPRPELAELWVILKILRNPLRRRAALTGFFSWKFRQKTGLSSRDVRDFIASHPGGDCYVFNPLTLQTALFASVWEQGERWHPGTTGHGSHLLRACGIEADLDGYVDGFSTTAYCNYLVGSPPFWKAYLALMRKVTAVLDRNRRVKVGPWQTTTHDHREYHFIPFLIERFFGVVVRLNPELRIIPYRYPVDRQEERTPGFGDLIARADGLKTQCRDNRDHPAFKEYLLVQREIRDRLQLADDPDGLILR